MAFSKIKAAYARMTNKPPQDPYTQKYAAQVQWYKMQGMTQRNPRLADVNYVAACRARGLDPVWEVIPHGFNRDLTFIRHDPPLHMTRAQIFPDRDKASETSSMRSQSSKGSSKVSFKDTVEVIGILPKTPKHATLQPLKGALKR